MITLYNDSISLFPTHEIKKGKIVNNLIPFTVGRVYTISVN